MATNTKNYNLIKPDVDDFYDVNQFNQNADIIDTQLKNNADSIKAIRTNDLTALPPVEATLNSGENALTTEHDSTARVTAFEGDTIVNYAPLFDSGLWIDVTSGNLVINAPNKVTINATGNDQHLRIDVTAKANTIYTLSVKHNALIGVNYLDELGNVISSSEWASSQNFTFTTPSNTSKIRIWLNNSTLGAGTYTFENVSLNEGAEAKPFVANVQGITNPTIDNETTGNSITLLGTFHEGDVVSEDKGQYTVTRAMKEVVLDGSKAWAFSSNLSGFKGVTLDGATNNFLSVYPIVVKYNGKILEQTTSKADSSWIDNSNGRLYVCIANTDSGWGDSYTPTADEIKAYFLGWRMYDDSIAGDIAQPYNGTGAKKWCYRTDNFNGVYNLQTALAGGTMTLPTTQAPINSKWKPYKLLYDLANPVKESVQAINSVLKLAKGDNALQVSEGRIVRERVKSFYLYNGGWYLANDKNQPNTIFDYKVGKILAVYEDGKPFTNFTINGTNAYGNQKIQIAKENFNPTAVYTVDYEPLYPFEVTAPTNPITIEYQSNLASVVGQNVEDIVELKEDVAVIQRDMVRKGEGIERITPTFLNGAISVGQGQCYYFKDSLDTVFVKLRFTHNSAVKDTVIIKFPVGFRPKVTTVAAGIVTNDGVPFYTYLTPTGELYVNQSTLSGKALAIDMVFKAEQ